MPNITRGGRMAGVLAYLAGPGRANEHTHPHVVAGDPSVLASIDVGELGRESAREVAQLLDAPRQAFGTAVLAGERPAHVWHCSLNLAAEEGQLGDEQWRQISEAFVERMGFAGEAPCPWVAVRHGLSKSGGDHVHLVVGLVREDGERADVWNDRPRAQEACGELEREFGLRVLESREAGMGPRTSNPAERELAARRGDAELPRDVLERVVRASAATSSSEAEFVQLVRAEGVRWRPRYATGSRETVVGYSVALRGDDQPWYGGGRLARDLTLPRLRERWAHPVAETADQAAHDAAGRLAACSLRSERRPGRIARESRALGRFAQTRASAPGLVLGAAVTTALRERVRAANREAELQRELDERDQQRHSPRAERDHGIGL